MNRFYSTTIATFMLVGFLLTSCNLKKEDPHQVKIYIKAPDRKGQKVSISSARVLSYKMDTLTTGVLDSSGTTTLTFSLAQPAFPYIYIGDSSFSLYTEPGYDLRLSLNHNKLSVQGTGAIPYEYIDSINSITGRFRTSGGKEFDQLTPKEVVLRIDSMISIVKKIDSSFFNQYNPPLPSQQNLQARTKSILLFYHSYLKDSAAVPREYVSKYLSQKAYIGSMPMTRSSLTNQNYAYLALFRSYLESQIVNPIWDSPEAESDLEMVALADKKIQSYPALKEIQEYARAFNLLYWLRQDGPDSQTDSIRAIFTKTLPQSDYLSDLKEELDKWDKIAPGRPAPSIAAKTPDGQTFSLSDLKGKVIYLDVWATWCGPCKEEFPHSEKIQRKFKGNPNVAFVYLSIDQDMEKWKKYLQKNPQLKGVHVNQPQNDQPADIWQSYRLSGIPRYILIDKAGRIVQAKAPRPSFGEVEDLINQTLMN